MSTQHHDVLCLKTAIAETLTASPQRARSHRNCDQQGEVKPVLSCQQRRQGAATGRVADGRSTVGQGWAGGRVVSRRTRRGRRELGGGAVGGHSAGQGEVKVPRGTAAGRRMLPRLLDAASAAVLARSSTTTLRSSYLALVRHFCVCRSRARLSGI